MAYVCKLKFGMRIVRGDRIGLKLMRSNCRLKNFQIFGRDDLVLPSWNVSFNQSREPCNSTHTIGTGVFVIHFRSYALFNPNVAFFAPVGAQGGLDIPKLLLPWSDAIADNERKIVKKVIFFEHAIITLRIRIDA